MLSVFLKVCRIKFSKASAFQHVTQGMASVRGESLCCRARSTLVRAQKVFSQAQQAFLAGCCEYAVPAFHAKFQWGTSEFCTSNVGFCEGKGPDFAGAEAKD